MSAPLTRLFPDLTTLAEFASRDPGRYHWRSAASFYGDPLPIACHRIRDGDLSYVARSEALLAKFESLSFPTFRKEWQSDVAGYIPDVGAFIAGHPASMRRRRRAEHEAAPITIVADVFASSAFSHYDITTRGAAILALTRILSAYRPITLYVAFCGVNNDNRSGGVAVQIDSTPLDLARAAYVLMAPEFLRRVMFSALQGVNPTRQSWTKTSLAMFSEAFPNEVLAIEGMSSHETSDPQGWIEARIRQAAPEILPGAIA